MRLFLVLFAVFASCKANFTITDEYISSILSPNSSIFIQNLNETFENDVNIRDEPMLDTDVYKPSIAEYDKFDWILTKRVAVTTNDNFLISPLGLKLSLAILMEAGTGATKSEISNVLGLPVNNTVVRNKFSKILESLQTNSSEYVLELGSHIYVGATVKPSQQFAAISQNFYHTEISSLDFNEPTQAAQSINQWVYNLTQGRIPNLVDAGDIEGVVALVLNTLFFKGTWKHKFDPNATYHQNFYVKADEKKSAPFMHIVNKFYYMESQKYNAKILRMPYMSQKFAMYIIVPNSLTGLPEIFNDISGLRSELLKLSLHLVDLSIPQFQFEYSSTLDGILKELGIRQAFEDTASFPGISRGQSPATRMKISKALQRAGIVINEVGSVAYSATVITLNNKFGTEDPDAILNVNKPFMFFIQDEDTRELLFTGRVSDPTLFDGAFKLP